MVYFHLAIHLISSNQAIFMYLINKKINRIQKIKKKSFTELGIKERENLQEWIANYPESLGEEILIIQKEFSGFTDTNERLDLLALDKEGNLIIIENKIDDSGKDVTWQCLKYASYCSSLKKSQIIKIYQDYLNKNSNGANAEEKICDFLDNAEIEETILNVGLSQRIFLVSGSFRKEVTSSVIWLLNYGLRIQCFQVTPYELGEQLFLNFEQIIPVKEAEEYSISMAEKTKEDIEVQTETKSRHKIRVEFWSQLLKEMNQQSDLFQNISPSKNSYIGKSSGIRGLSYVFVAGKNCGRVELYIDRGETEENKKLFDSIFNRKEAIESSFGHSLEWERLDNKKACRIKFEDSRLNLYDKENWQDMISFLVRKMIKFEEAMEIGLTFIKKEHSL